MEHAQAGAILGAKCTVLDAELRQVSEGAERLRRALTVAAEALATERKRSEETSVELERMQRAAQEQQQQLMQQQLEIEVHRRAGARMEEVAERSAHEAEAVRGVSAYSTRSSA